MKKKYPHGMTDITPENAHIIAEIDGYNAAIDHGIAAKQFATFWTGPALDAYNRGVGASLSENKKTIDLTHAMTPEELEEAERRCTDEQERAYRKKFAASGGRAKSEKKTLACRENGKKGGWPKGKLRGKRTAGGEAHTGAMWPTREFTEKDLPF